MLGFVFPFALLQGFRWEEMYRDRTRRVGSRLYMPEDGKYF
jgi:hypothetical protein